MLCFDQPFELYACMYLSADSLINIHACMHRPLILCAACLAVHFMDPWKEGATCLLLLGTFLNNRNSNQPFGTHSNNHHITPHLFVCWHHVKHLHACMYAWHHITLALLCGLHVHPSIDVYYASWSTHCQRRETNAHTQMKWMQMKWMHCIYLHSSGEKKGPTTTRCNVIPRMTFVSYTHYEANPEEKIDKDWPMVCQACPSVNPAPTPWKEWANNAPCQLQLTVRPSFRPLTTNVLMIRSNLPPPTKRLPLPLITNVACRT